MVWLGPTNGPGLPSITLPNPAGKGRGRKVSARRELAKALGHDVEGLFPTTTCANRQCMGRDHLVVLTKSDLVKRAAERTGYPQRMSRRAKISAAKRATFASCTPEQEEEIRHSSEPATTVGRRLGVSWQVSQAIRSGERRASYNASPFDGLGQRK